jgi:hypothetical protein
MNYVAVRSDHVQAVAYDEAERTMGVVFTDGSEYLYEGVPAEVHRYVRTAMSVGRALSEVVKGRYAYQRVR